MTSNIKQQLIELENSVFAKRPVLGKHYHGEGDMPLAEFTRQQFAFPKNEHLPEERIQEAISIIAEHVEKSLGGDAANGVSEQLKEIYAVTTADHQGPLTDPGFLNNNLLINFSKAVKYDIVLACANISFDNDSFPRGHFFHSKKDDEIITNQLVLFPRRVRPLTVVYHPSYTQEAIIEAEKRVQAWLREGTITQSSAEKLTSLLTTIYVDPAVLACDTFSEQVTKTNFALWKKLTNGHKQSDLVYIEQEGIVNELILHHLDRDTIIQKILCSTEYHERILTYFDGISGGFSLKDNYGTFLFWAVPPGQKYRQQLWKKGDRLITSDESYSLELTPRAIRNAVEQKILIPSTLLSFMILGFYYGLTLIGGGGQTTYYTKMKEAYLAMLRELGNESEAKISEHVQTTRQALPYSSIAFLTGTNGIFPATTVDLLLYAEEHGMETLSQLAEKVTVKEVLARALPDMPHSVPEDSESLTVSDIDSLTGFGSVIQTIGQIT